MLLSTKGRYGIKAMIDLALIYDTGGKLSVAQLAEKQGVSVAYLEQIIASLKKHNLVVSARGAAGGYSLALPPDKIYVNTVLNALEGGTTIVDCVGTAGAECGNACICSARPLWLKLQNRIDDVLNSTSIRDMADEYTIQKERMNTI